MLAEASRSKVERALAFAARHINASIPNPVTSAQIQSWIAPDGSPVQDSRLRAFLNEAHTSALQDMVILKITTYARLADLADAHLSATHDTRKWLDARRNF